MLCVKSKAKFDVCRIKTFSPGITVFFLLRSEVVQAGENLLIYF